MKNDANNMISGDGISSPGRAFLMGILIVPQQFAFCKVMEGIVEYDSFAGMWKSE